MKFLFNRTSAALRTIPDVLALSPAPRKSLSLLVVLGLAAALADGLSTSLIVLLIYSMMGKAADILSTNGTVGKVLASINPDLLSGLPLVVFIFALVILNIVLTFIYTTIAANVRYRLSEAVRNRLGKQFWEVSYDFILRHDQGHLINVWNGESWLMGDAYLAIVRLIIDTCSSVIFITLLAIISWKLLIISGVSITILFLAMHRLSRPARALGSRMREEHEKIAQRMLVALQGMRALRAFAQEARYQREFETASAQVRQTSITFERLHALVSPAVQLGYLLLLVAIVFAGTPLGVSFAGTLTFLALLYRYQPYARELQSNLLSIAQLQASVASVMSVLDRSDKIYVTSGGKTFNGLQRELRVESVSFTYAGASSSSLDRISFIIPAGSVTALVGKSGAGKTTIVNLLLGLYRPDSGSILVDGVPLKELRSEDWLTKISIAGQDAELVEGTVKDNLRVAQPEADLEAMRDVGETARILETIENLPHGFDSWIGQHGLQLSGGQRQRLGIARALLRNPDILILDEATNALNNSLEQEILSSVRHRLAGRTLIIVTHRLETAMSADQVICIDAGHVVEYSSPAKPFRSTFERLLGASEEYER